VYIGDGQPTVGALLPGELRDRLARLGHPPRVFTVGIGAEARHDLLEALAAGGGLSLRVDDRPEAAHAAYRILAAAALPTLRDVTFDLGPDVDVAYPTGLLTVSAGEPLRLVGRMRTGALPKRVKLAGVRDGKPFSVEIPLAAGVLDDTGDVRRRWAAGRLRDLLARGAGREAVVEVGTRFALVTPWSAMTTAGHPEGTRGGASWRPLDDSPAGAFGFSPFARRDRAPEDGPIALEEGVTSTASGALDLDRLYVRVMGERDEAVRSCYERRAASHPELSGRVEVKVKVGLVRAVAPETSEKPASSASLCCSR